MIDNLQDLAKGAPCPHLLPDGSACGYELQPYVTRDLVDCYSCMTQYRVSPVLQPLGPTGQFQLTVVLTDTGRKAIEPRWHKQRHAERTRSLRRAGYGDEK